MTVDRKKQGLMEQEQKEEENEAYFPLRGVLRPIPLEAMGR
jgi:hypothetical protein